MIPVNHNKRALETFIVAGASTALYNVAGSGNNLTNGSGNVVLSAGQLGFFSTSAIGGTVALNVATDATPTITECPSLCLYQGTSESASASSATGTYPLWVRPYEKTESLEAGTQVYVTKQLYVAPTHAVTVIGANSGSTAITPVDLTEYQMAFAYRGRIVDELFGAEAAAYDRFTFTTPNYTTLATVSPLDHLVQNMAYQANLNSRLLKLTTDNRRPNGPYVVFAVGTAGTAISGFAAGTPIDVVTVNGVTKTFNPTAAQVASLQAAATASGFTHVVTINLTTAGAAANAKGLMIMALDRVTSYKDFIPNVKVKIAVSLTSGFNTSARNLEVVRANEGQGVARTLDLMYKASEGQRKYNNRHTEDPVVEFASPIDLALTYVTYVIHHSHSSAIGIAQMSVSPYKEIICVPSTNTTLIGQLDTALNAWLASNGSPAVTEIG